MGIDMEELPGQMSLSALEDRCASEINNYRRREPSNDRYCLEIFRRALLQHDDNAWEMLQHRFSPLVLGWMRRHPRRDAACRYDSEENYVAQAFSRFWQATAHNQELEFDTLAAALRYLQASLNGAIMDTLRAYSRPKDVAWPEPGIYFPEEPSEPSVEDDDEGRELWEIVSSLLPDQRERRVAYLLFRCGLKPREIIHRCSEEFSEVREVYRLRRNIIERLTRHSDLIRWRISDEES